MICGSLRIPGEFVEKVEDIQAILKQINVQVWHVFREANQLADAIANAAINTEHKLVFQHFHQLPSLGKRILNISNMKSLLLGSKQGEYTTTTVNMLSYNIHATGFYSYTIYKENFIYFWSKKAA